MSGPSITQAWRDEALADIRRYISDPEDLRHALKQFYALTEYAPGDERVCTWESALDNCEQVKGYFPPTTPEPVLENIDRIEAEIRRCKKQGRPALWRVLTSSWVVISIFVLGVALWLMWRFVPRM